MWHRGGKKGKDAGIVKTRMETKQKKERKKEKEQGEEAQHLRKGKAWHWEAEEQAGGLESQARAGAARSEPNICLALS